MIELKTATDRIVQCNSVVRSQMYNYLYIHTASLTRIEADTIFDNPAETSVLTAYGTDPDGVWRSNVFTGWTVLESVTRSPVYPDENALMIILTKPISD